MELTQLNVEELIELEKLLQSATTISKIYDKLCELEINNQKKSKEYASLIEKLTAEITKENELYQNSNMTCHRCLKYSKLISDRIAINLSDDNLFTTLKSEDMKAFRRVQITLRAKMRLDPEYQNGLLQEATKMKGLPKPLPNLSDSIRIDYELNKDITSVFLSILESSIEIPQNKEYRSQLIKAKYCISLVYKELEKLLLPSKFTMTPYVYINSKIIVEMLNKNKEAYDSIKYSKLKSELSIQLNRLLEIPDEVYNTPNPNINLIISPYYIRALLSLMAPVEVDAIESEFNDTVTSPEYLRLHVKNRISKSIIIDCFKYFSQDRGRSRILSLKSE